jgi:hypothetical protein
MGNTCVAITVGTPAPTCTGASLCNVENSRECRNGIWWYCSKGCWTNSGQNCDPCTTDPCSPDCSLYPNCSKCPNNTGCYTPQISAPIVTPTPAPIVTPTPAPIVTPTPAPPIVGGSDIHGCCPSCTPMAGGNNVWCESLGKCIGSIIDVCPPSTPQPDPCISDPCSTDCSLYPNCTVCPSNTGCPVTSVTPVIPVTPASPSDLGTGVNAGRVVQPGAQTTVETTTTSGTSTQTGTEGFLSGNGKYILLGLGLLLIGGVVYEGRSG